DNKIRVTVVAIDDGGVRSDESAEIAIDVKADKLPYKPGISIKAGDIRQTDLIWENKPLTLEATVPANESAEVKEYRWYVNGQLQSEKGKQLTYTTPAYDKNKRGLIFKVKAVGKRDQESDASDETKLILMKSTRDLKFKGYMTGMAASKAVPYLNSQRGVVHGTVAALASRGWFELTCDPGYVVMNEGNANPSRQIAKWGATYRTNTPLDEIVIENDYSTTATFAKERYVELHPQTGLSLGGGWFRQDAQYGIACWPDPDSRPW
ncbi:hypothetical protein IB685_06425, partial [Francisella tularensis subsp. novicida FSC159]|nr:hypothetical protein [Francisella tularensis subsp. novicida FSC159]